MKTKLFQLSTFFTKNGCKKTIYSFMAIILLVMIACSSDDDSSNPVVDGGGVSYVKMKVNGVQWEADGYVVIGQSNYDGMYNFTLSGNDSNFSGASSTLSSFFSLSEDITEGTYEVKLHDGAAGVTGVNGGTFLCDATTESHNVTIVITEIQGSGSAKKFKGTFSGTLLGGSTGGETITITDGEFSNL